MKRLLFSTTNDDKFQTAQHVCQQHGIELIQQAADIVEIQSEDPEAVAIDKVAKAFEHFKQPVVITDDSWSFLGLGGFPGVYMHSMNHWFTAEDFLRLTASLPDRRVTFTQNVVYADGERQQLFSRQTPGQLLAESRGHSQHPSLTIVTLDGDDGLSIAEVHERDPSKWNPQVSGVWQEFAQWYGEVVAK